MCEDITVDNDCGVLVWNKHENHGKPPHMPGNTEKWGGKYKSLVKGGKQPVTGPDES